LTSPRQKEIPRKTCFRGIFYDNQIRLILAMQEPEREKHQEQAQTRGAEQQHGEEFLRTGEEQHAQCNDQVYHINEDQGGNSFIHGMRFRGQISKIISKPAWLTEKTGARWDIG
jgi:hypothetical protein